MIDSRKIISRCTMGYAFALALRVAAEGWTYDAVIRHEQMVTRISLWHSAGLSSVWS